MPQHLFRWIRASACRGLCVSLGLAGLALALTSVAAHASPSARSPDGAAPSAVEPAPQPPARRSFDTADEGAPTPRAFRFDGSYVAAWSRRAARAIALDPNTTIPYLIPAHEPFHEGVYVWDAWPLRTPDGAVAEIAGWNVLIALTAKAGSDSPYPFYSRSTWRFYYAKDGRWLPGGVLFDRTAALGSRQWAGSAVYDPQASRATFYYTAVGDPQAADLASDAPRRALPSGHPAAGRPDTTQRMAAVSASVSAGANGVAFSDFSAHELILEADGEIYATRGAFIPDQVIYGMRDPEYWRDGETGAEYILFTANAAGFPSPHNGVVGLARRIDGEWQLQRPILVAPGVSSQLERPHLVRRDDGLYLFFSTHAFTFADGLSGPEGLYGFYSKSGDLYGLWQPINGHGLVAGNPPQSPTQAYSFLVLPDGRVMSYVNTPYGFKNDPAESRKMVGGPAPMFRIALEQGQSTIVAAPTPTRRVD
jgi:levansucrase